MSDTLPGPTGQCPYCTAKISVVRTAFSKFQCPGCGETVELVINDDSGSKHTGQRQYVLVWADEMDFPTVFGPYDHEKAENVYIHFKQEDVHSVVMGRQDRDGAVWSVEDSADISPWDGGKANVPQIELRPDGPHPRRRSDEQTKPSEINDYKP